MAASTGQYSIGHFADFGDFVPTNDTPFTPDTEPGFWGGVTDGLTKFTSTVAGLATSAATAYGQYQDARLARDINDARIAGIKEVVRGLPAEQRAQLPSFTKAVTDNDGAGRDVQGAAVQGILLEQGSNVLLWGGLAFLGVMLLNK